MWELKTFPDAAGTAGPQDDQVPGLGDNKTNPSAAITFLDGSNNPIANPVIQNLLLATIKVRITQFGSGIKYVDIAVPTCFSSPTNVVPTVSGGGNGGYVNT